MAFMIFKMFVFVFRQYLDEKSVIFLTSVCVIQVVYFCWRIENQQKIFWINTHGLYESNDSYRQKTCAMHVISCWASSSRYVHDKLKRFADLYEMPRSNAVLSNNISVCFAWFVWFRAFAAQRKRKRKKFIPSRIFSISVYITFTVFLYLANNTFRFQWNEFCVPKECRNSEFNKNALQFKRFSSLSLYIYIEHQKQDEQIIIQSGQRKKTKCFKWWWMDY